MGERGNIVFLFHADEHGGAARRVYFYTHWRGHLLHEILREAMNTCEVWPAGFGELTGKVRESCRWYDATYFARVVFCRMVEGDEHGVLSFGIGPDRVLPDYDEFHIDVDRKEIRQVRLDMVEDGAGRWIDTLEVVVATWTFDEFAAGITKPEIDGQADLGVQP